MSEAEIYLNSDLLPEGSDVLKYWSGQENVYPTLADLARKYLAIPASQASSERLFSTGGAIARDRRANTGQKESEMLRPLVMLKLNK